MNDNEIKNAINRMMRIAYNLGYRHRLEGRPRSLNPWNGAVLSNSLTISVARQTMAAHWRLGWRHANMEKLENE